MKVEAPFIHLIKLHTKYYLYDVNSKMIVNISNDLFDFFKSNENIKAEIEIPHKLEDEVRRLLKYDLFSKTDTGYEIEYPQGTNLEEILNNCMRIMTLQVTQNCNLRCKYCVYSGSYSNRVHSNKRMSFETAKSAIDFLYAHSSMTTSIGIGFYGGEPLLEFDLLKKCVEYAKMKFIGKDLSFTLTTNATLLTEEIMKFFVKNNFFVTISFDGPQVIQDKNRVLVLLFIPIKAVVMKYFAKYRKKVMDEFILDSEKYSSWFGDTVGGVKEVKLFDILDNKHREFDEKQRVVIRKQKKMNMLSQWNSAADDVLVHLLITLIYIVGSNLVFNMQLSVGSIFAFITYSSYVTGPISAILNIGYLLSGIIPSTKRYYMFMELDEENSNQKITTSPQFGDIELKNISFAYEEGKPILDGVSVIFTKGSKTAIIGRNGSGKTTIINLLTRLYEPENGQILLNGTNIADMSLQAYREMVSIVSQQIYLFNDSIRNNICLYKQVSDAMLKIACRDSGLEDFIKEVSLDYVVGQNGAMLSGGQKQKIALARALIHDKPIIIFDEATSNTDAYSEQQINALLHTGLRDKTVIVITHKKEVLSEVDQIVVLDDGKIDIVGGYEAVKKSKYWLQLRDDYVDI